MKVNRKLAQCCRLEFSVVDPISDIVESAQIIQSKCRFELTRYDRCVAIIFNLPAASDSVSDFGCDVMQSQ